jgi:hypothetical protein
MIRQFRSVRTGIRGSVIGALVVASIVAADTSAGAEVSAASTAAAGSGAELARTKGTVVRRSTMEGNLTAADRESIRELGFGRLHAGAVVIRKIMTNHGQQLARLRDLVSAVEGFKPAGLCDKIVRQGVGRGICHAQVEGPIGAVPLRLPLAAELFDAEAGGQQFLLRNVRSLEVKPLFSWTEIVKPNGMKVAIDLFPQPDGWLVYTRVGLAFSDHENAAEKLLAALLQLDNWLAQELAQS